MIPIIRTGRRFADKVKQDYVNAFSGQAALFIIISVFPIVIMLLNIIQFLPITKTDFQKAVIYVLPDSFSALAYNIIEELYLKSSGTMLSVSALATLWSASRGTLAIANGMNAIYGIKETRNYVVLRLISCLYTVSFVAIIIFSLSILVFGNSIYGIIASKFPIFEALAATFISLRVLIALCLLMLFFTFIYMVMPNRKVHFRYQIPGALFSSAGWMAFSFVFSVYIDNFNNYSNTYGSLTAIVLLMLWLYICMYILFLGGEINVFFEASIERAFQKKK